MGAVWLMRRLMTLGGLVMLAGCAPLAVSGSSQDVFTGSVPVEITCRLNDQGEVTDLLEPDGSEAQRTPS
jgi:hypothetical protein